MLEAFLIGYLKASFVLSALGWAAIVGLVWVWLFVKNATLD